LSQIASKIDNYIFHFSDLFQKFEIFKPSVIFLKLFSIFVDIFRLPPAQIQKRDISKDAYPKETKPKEFTTPNIDSKVDEKFGNLEKELKEMSKKIHEMMKEINGLNKEMANIWEEIGNGKKKNADTNEWENDEK